MTSTKVKTPYGSIVPETYIFTAGPNNDHLPPNQSQINAWIAYLDTYYCGATYEATKTRTYNCHGYAWHMSEGGSPVWIDLCPTAGHHKYWLDGSYTAVAENVATKVTYTGNHSAVRLNSNWYRSKWGPEYLVTHKPNCVLTGYGSTNGYYVNPTCHIFPLKMPKLGYSKKLYYTYTAY